MFKFKRSLSISLSVILAATVVQTVSFRNNTVHAATANIVSVDPSLQYQTMDGWGTSLAWWADLLGQWKTSAKDQVMDLIFDPVKGLGLNMVRYNIGGAKSPADTNLRPGADIESFELPDGTYDWTKDAGQRWVLEEAKKRIAANDFKAEAFSNSPPYFMTKSGQSSGNDNGSSNLDVSKSQEFADYLTNVVDHFKNSWGINFDTVEPMNEPSTNYWKKGGNQEGCDFDAPAEKDAIYSALSKSLADKGLNTKITGFDETSIDISATTIKNASQSTISTISQFNTHDYGGSQRTQLRDLAASLGKPLYMDEICTSVGPCDANYIDNGLAMADYLFKDLRDMKVTGWDLWQAVDDEQGNEDSNNNYGFIRAYWSGDKAEQYVITKQFYATAQFTKYIRPGYKIIDSNNSDVVAAIDPNTNKLVLVARNTSTSDKPFTFDVSKFNTANASIKAYRTSATESLADISGGLSVNAGDLSDTLPAKSIVTYVISNAAYNGEIGTTINDNVIGTNDNQFQYSSSGWGYNDSQTGAYSNDAHYSNTLNSNYQVKFNGNKVKLYGASAPDAGIVGISIDGGAETKVDLYSTTRQDNALMYTSPLLTEQEHTVTVRVTGEKNAASSSNYLTVDRVVAIKNSTDTVTVPKPQLSQLTARDGSLWLKFNPVDGATSYNVKYGTTSGNYTKIINNITDTSYLITGLQDGTKYYVAVSAVVNGQETNISNELAETPGVPANPNLLYYVNCGDSSPNSLETGEVLGTNNSLEDQAYGLDQLTGYNWGYILDGGIGWSQDIEASVGSNYGTERQYDGSDPQGGLSYKFDVPDGKYLVTMGFYDPWSHPERLEDIVINGTTVAQALCPYTIGKVPNYYTADASNGNLTVRVQRSATTLNGKTDKPLVSWIKIEKYTKVSSMSFDKNELSIERTKTATLTPIISPDAAPYKDVKWSSSDPTIATVDNGVVTALKEGTAKISATSVDNPSAVATCDLTVKQLTVDVPVKSISINYPTVNMNLNDSVKLATNVLPSNATLKTVIWSSSDEKVVKVAADGTLTPVGYGTATVKAVSIQDEVTTDTCTVNVVKGYNLLYFANAGDNDPTGFDQGEDIPQLNSREDQAYGQDPVTGKSWGYVLSVDGQTWSQDQEHSAGNDKYNCLRQFNGNDPGKGITYKFEVPNGSYNIDMGFYDPWSSKTRLEDIVINGDTKLTGFVMGGNKVKKSFYNVKVTDGILSVAVLNSNGSKDNPFLSWISVGSYVPTDSVTINNSSLSLKVGDTSSLSATQNPWQADAESQVTWTSSNEKVATVDATGKVTAVAPGTADIKAISVDGNEYDTCSVTVLNNDATLSDMAVNGTELTGFDSNKEEYTVTIPTSSTEIPQVTATVNDKEANAVITQATSLDGTANIVVTAADGVSKKTYTVKFVVLSSDATLSGIVVNGTELTGFDCNKVNYIVTVPASTTEIPQVTATVNDKEAKVVITQATSLNGTANIVVTAADGVSKKTYTVKFVVALSSDATLNGIAVNGTAVTGFASNNQNYTVTLPAATTQIPQVTATVNDKAAKAVITQAASLDGTANIVVTAADGVTKETYTVKFVKEKIIVPTKLNDKIDDIVNAINNLAGSTSINLDANDYGIAGKVIFDAIKGADKTVVFSTNNAQWTFNGKDITSDTKAIDLNVKTQSLSDFNGATKAGIQAKVNSQDVFVISFAENGILPGKATVRIKLDGNWLKNKDKNNLNIYYYNPTTKETEVIAKQLKVDNDGYVQFQITHNSDYFVADKEITQTTIATNTNTNTNASTTSTTTTNSTSNTTVLPKTGYMLDFNTLFSSGIVLLIVGISTMVFRRRKITK